MGTSKELNVHIEKKIEYHEKLRLMHEAKEEYEQCAKHRDEIARLTNMKELATT